MTTQDPRFTLYTFGDSILDCQWNNDASIAPGQLLVRNDDELFPEFQGEELTLGRLGPFSGCARAVAFRRMGRSRLGLEVCALSAPGLRLSALYDRR
jgi:hypothetical protein